MSSSKKYSKNEEYEIVITDIGTNGEGIGHLDDGYTLFVQGAIPGDRVLAHIIKPQKNYAHAKVARIVNASENRIEARCPVANRCGGCQISSLSYLGQLEYKERKVRELLIRVGGFEADYIDEIMDPIIGFWDKNESPEHFRNKAQYPVGEDAYGNVMTGFYSVHSHRIIPCRECLIGAPVDKFILDAILRYMEAYHISAYDEKTGKGLIRHILVRSGFATGEVMVCLVINGKSIPAKKELVDLLLECNERCEGNWTITSICTSSNTQNTNVIMGEKFDVVYGKAYITDKIGTVSFNISPLSFYQVNPTQTQKLYGKALEYAGLTGNETVWDLYCGIGTISLFLAQNAGKVYGVEIIPQAIENAKENAKINNIDNVEFFVGKAEEVLPEFYEKCSATAGADAVAINPDVIVVDPPRKGCDEECLNTMLRMKPERIVYVSCDPATLARDLKYLCEDGKYRLKKVVPVDMFSNSVHVESVCLLSKVQK